MAKQKILFTGPECSGKTSLAKAIVYQLKASYVPEYARAYMTLLGRKASMADIKLVYKNQLLLEDWIGSTAALLICDTSVLEQEEWMQIDYGQPLDVMKSVHHLKSYDFIFLCKPDFAYEDDFVRSHEDNRIPWYARYKDFLDTYQLSYHELTGDLERRQKKVLGILEKT